MFTTCIRGDFVHVARARVILQRLLKNFRGLLLPAGEYAADAAQSGRHGCLQCLGSRGVDHARGDRLRRHAVFDQCDK